MATLSLGDVVPDVIRLERRPETDEPEDLEEGFMTLEQARPILGERYYFFKERVWDNVVRVTVQTNSGELECGTGFLFLSVAGRSMIMTNYHVVRNRRPGTAIQVCFDFDGPGIPALWYNCANPLYCSRDCQEVGEGVDENHRDFAVFRIYGEVHRTPMTLQHSAERANFSFQQGMKGIIVGHPNGAYKRLSIVDLHPDPDDGFNIERRYSPGTRPGSSGSPVLSSMDLVSAVALHYGVRRKKHCDTCTCGASVGVGVNILDVIDFIKRSPLTQRELQVQAQGLVVPPN